MYVYFPISPTLPIKPLQPSHITYEQVLSPSTDTTDLYQDYLKPFKAYYTKVHPSPTYTRRRRLIGGGTKGNKPTTKQMQIIDLTKNDIPITRFDNVIYPRVVHRHGVVSIAAELVPKNSWQPTNRLQHQKGNHPIELTLEPQTFEHLKLAVRQNPMDVIAYLSNSRAEHVTAADLRELLSHGTMTNDSIMNTFLTIFSEQHNVTFLSTFFIHILKRDQSWAGVSTWFTQYPIFETSTTPLVNSTQPVLIPCHVQDSHWVGIVRRVIKEKVYFLYADDLNRQDIEQQMQELLHAHAPAAFYPNNATWITCKSTTFYPHSNECGPRTLFALVLMAIHPSPTDLLLQPYMDPNLAQILRTWVASVIITGNALLPELYINTSAPRIGNQRGVSQPRYLFPWTDDRAPPAIRIQPTKTSSSILPKHPKHCHNRCTSSISVKQIMKTPPNSKQINNNPKRIQLTIPDTFNQPVSSTPDHTLDEVWGHYPVEIDANATLRIVFTNPRGLKLSTDILETEYSLGRCQALGVGVICAAESNLNWENLQVQKKFHGMIRKIWKHTKVSKSHTKEGFQSERQPGGTVTIVCNQWTSRVIESGVDPFGLGRWSYVVLRGKGNIKILLITAYRVCRQTIQTAGPTTSTSQQFRALSAQFRTTDHTEDPVPRHQFIVDLQSWIELMVDKGYQIILGIDANEPFSAENGNYTPVAFTLDHPIPTKGHDGTLGTLIRTCGLCDPLLQQHPDTPPPPTYDRGTEKIDFLFVSASLISTVVRSGIFPYNSLFVCDHRPCYIDLAGDQLFKEHTPVIAPPQYRGLKLDDPRIVEQYTSTLIQQLNYHKVFKKTTTLLDKAKGNQWSSEDTTQYERLDQIITEAMLRAERSVSKKVSLTYQWSPKLKAAINSLTYWKLRLSQLKGKVISANTLSKTFQQTKLPMSAAGPLSVEKVIQEIRQARSTLKEVQRKHVELREQHLEELVDAIILFRTPHLLDPGKESAYKKKKAKEIRRIQRKESLARLHRKIGFTLKPDTVKGGLRFVDIPYTAEKAPFPIGPDPKVWEGPWYTTNDPSMIAKHVCAANSRQYHQAHQTPCGMEPLASYLGYKANTPGCEGIIEGNGLPPEIVAEILPETATIFQTLTSLAEEVRQPVPNQITPEQFTSCYKAMDERTSSSPSGRHLGHYKAAARSKELATLHSTMMSIPLTAGFSPARWRQIVDVMLEKKPGDHRIHRLRIVALQESDFNQSNRLAIGRPLQQFLEKQQLVPDMQHGSRASKLCQSAVLNKQLTFEIHRYAKKPIAYIENDAVGCYDRIMNPLILLFLRILGLSPSVVSSLAQTWEQTYHRIKTLYGISKEEYRNESDWLLYGPGQGSTIGPFLWLLCFILIFQSLGNSIPKITLQPVNTNKMVQYIGEAFVDDAGLGTNADGENHVQLVTNLQTLAQRWEKLLFSTGGALNLTKCFWFSMSWKWVGGKPTLHNSNTTPGSLQMTSENEQHLITIPRIEPTESFRTLGVFISPAGSNKGALKILTTIVLDYCTILRGSSLTRQETLTSYIQYLLPKLRFQPPVLSLSQHQCDKLTSTVMAALLPKLHVNRNTARSIIFGPETYGGLSLPNLYITQGIDKLRLFLGHLRTQDRTAQLIHIDMTYVQLLTGSGKLFLNQPEQNFRWIETGWLQSLWSFTSRYSFTFLYPDGWVPASSREHDQYLMEAFIQMKVPIKHMRILNRCRIYLQVILLSDITTADGVTIVPEIKQGIRLEDRTSNLLWPTQGDPLQGEWRLWRHYLSTFEDKGKLQQPLGKWIAATHQEWSHFIDPITSTVFRKSNNRIKGYPALPSTRALRSGYWYDNAFSQDLPDIPPNVRPATIINQTSTDGSLFQVKASQNNIPAGFTGGPNQYDRLFYQRLLPQGELIPYDHLLNEDTLHISIEATQDATAGHSSCSWRFQTESFTYTGGHTMAGLCTQYRAALRGILTVIYILHTAEQRHPSNECVNVILQCNHKTALKEAFRSTPIGVTTATQPNHDLVLDIRYLRNLVRSKLTSCHTPGSSCDQVYPIQSNPLNLDLISDSSLHQKALTEETTPLSHIITLVHNGEAFHGNIKTRVHEVEYKKQLEDKLKKDNGWSDHQFQQINWSGYYTAFKRIPRSHRISIMKLSHKVWNTNAQNEKFYGHKNNCPICGTSVEDVAHVYKCTHTEATANRREALSSFITSIQKGTPQILLEAISSGLDQWTTTNGGQPQAPTCGSRLPSLRLVTAAFDTQTQLGWDSFHRGHIAKQWEEAFRNHYRPKKTLDQKQMSAVVERWSRLLITSLWTYTEKLWRFRNQVVHGKTELNKISKKRGQLIARATDLYNQFNVDPFMLPSSRNYLFNRPLMSTIEMGQDALEGWIRLVEEGIHTREHRERLAAKALKRTLHAFLSQKQSSKSSTLAGKGSLWKPPFSKSYYKRLIEVNRTLVVGKNQMGNKRRKAHKSTKGSKVRKQLGRTPGERSLLEFGFQIVKPTAKKTKQDSAPMVLEEFSGTRISTAP